jgi:hypothetical protein
LFEDTSEYHEDGWTSNAMEAADLIAAGKKVARRWRWTGWKAGYRRVWLTGATTYSEFWVGWKLGSSVPGLGFTVQARFNRRIGT